MAVVGGFCEGGIDVDIVGIVNAVWVISVKFRLKKTWMLWYLSPAPEVWGD